MELLNVMVDKLYKLEGDGKLKALIEASHISEAISYRSLDRDFWM